MNTNSDSLNLNLPLSPRLAREIERELEDHIACAEAREPGAGKQVKEKLADAKIVRKLAAPHVTDQVVATLTRWPNQNEWREFAWLLIWFVVLYLGELLASSRGVLFRYGNFAYGMHAESRTLLHATVVAWLFLGIGRAGFFMQLIGTLVRAYKTGIGVFIARIIQLKLIHTVIVSAGYMTLPTSLFRTDQFDWEWKTGAILNGFTIVGASIALALVLCVIMRRRFWLCGAFALLLGLFLFQGAPARTVVYNESGEYARTGKHYSVPFQDFSSIPLSAFYQKRGLHADFNKPMKVSGNFRNVEIVKSGPWWTMPYIEAGAGLGWLALLIPLLAFAGLMSMVWILGRRSMLNAIVYALLAFYAFETTIGPFVWMGADRIVCITPHSFIVAGPLDCFSRTLSGAVQSDLLPGVFGFFLSALIPWLMVGLFAATRVKATRMDKAQ